MRKGLGLLHDLRIQVEIIWFIDGDGDGDSDHELFAHIPRVLRVTNYMPHMVKVGAAL